MVYFIYRKYNSRNKSDFRRNKLVFWLETIFRRDWPFLTLWGSILGWKIIIVGQFWSFLTIFIVIYRWKFRLFPAKFCRFLPFFENNNFFNFSFEVGDACSLLLPAFGIVPLEKFWKCVIYYDVIVMWHHEIIVTMLKFPKFCKSQNPKVWTNKYGASYVDITLFFKKEAR